MFHFYTAYGLGIQSALLLPELHASAEALSDITITSGDLSEFSVEGDEESSFHQIPDGHSLYWNNAGRFAVRGGREIIVDALPGVEADLLRLPLLGTVLAMALHQRGLLILHGSAVIIDGGAVVFAGSSGQGKSTMTAALQTRGHQLVTDDIVAVQLGADQPPRVWPSFPRIKLWPDAISALGLDPEDHPKINSWVEKRSCRSDSDFPLNSVPLRAIYFLERGEEIGIEPLRGQAGLIELLRNTYLSAFGRSMLGDTEMRQMQQCVRVARQSPLQILRRPGDLSLLPAIARLVEENLRQ